jgi:hypothetical protein
MKTPLLFDLPRLQGRPNAEKLRHDLIVKHFGEWTECDEWPDVVTVRALWNQLTSACRRECESAAAEELLLRLACKLDVPASWRTALANIRPFGDDDSLSALADKACACALFPIHSEYGDAGMGHLWLFAKPDKQPTRKIRHSPRHWHGDSCQLAAALAKKALTHSDPVMIRKLATQWIVTGQENSGAIDPVELGNKLTLAPYSARKWMIPADNRRMLPRQFPGSAGYRLTHNVESAWKHILGHGVLRRNQTDWPRIDAFHSFTSGAREPVLASILLSPGVSHQLWHTNAGFSRNSALDIVKIMGTLGVALPAPKEIASNDMAEVETEIGRVLVPQLEQGADILFNITQGNRLMSFAAHSLAQQYENLLLIYRDLDAEPFQFTLIHYEGGHPVTQTIRGKDQRNDIAWEPLFFKPTPRDPESWQDLLKRIRKTNSVPASTML